MRVVLFGGQRVGIECLRALLDLNHDVVAVFTSELARDEAYGYESLARFAAAAAIPVHQSLSVGRTELGQLQRTAADVYFSAYYRWVLPSPALGWPSRGAFNLHPSLLPLYRGPVPLLWAILNGERQAGVTLHQMVAAVDAGPIVAQRTLMIDPEETGGELHARAMLVAAQLFRDALPMFDDREVPLRPQDHRGGTYFGAPRPELRRVDWQSSTRRVLDVIRAFSHPYEGAFTVYRGQRLTIWRARAAPEEERAAFGHRPAGRVLEAREDRLRVATPDGAVDIMEHEWSAPGTALRAGRDLGIEEIGPV